MDIPYKTRIVICAFSLLMVIACGGGGGGDDTPPSPPVAASLIFPENNSECNEGVVISETQSDVTFRWNASSNTTGYTLKIKNLVTQQTDSYESPTPQYTATISRGTPYSWYVISKNRGTTQTAQSPEWKFYNAGEGVESHPPFPADAVFPAMGASINASSGEVSLQWKASDIDADILNYDVYIEQGVNPPAVKKATVNEAYYAVPVTTNSVYYWRIITRDKEGNTSQSAVFQFKVN